MAFTAFAAEERPSRVDIISKPSGANIYVDGKNAGTAPVTLHSLDKGLHHVRAVMDNYEQYDTFFEVLEGAYLQIDCPLVLEKGLLLLTTEPEGCQIEHNGLAIGQTPKLITHLPVGKSFCFEFSKVGYKTKKIEVFIKDRVPVSKHEVLVQDSGSLEVLSEPIGAEVYMQGIRRGVTPITLSSIPKGNVEIEIKKDGYATYRKVLLVRSGASEMLNVSLNALPASMELTVIPTFATVELDGKIVGKGSQKLNNVLPGEHSIRIYAEGFDPIEENISIDKGAAFAKTFKLSSNGGSLKVTTIPYGAEIYLNGEFKGRTKKSDSNDQKSETLYIENIPEGDYDLVAKLDGYTDVKRKPKIRKHSQSQANIKFKAEFIPDVEVQTLTKKVKGRYIEKNAEGIVIETRPGVKQTIRQSDLKGFMFLK
jgi:hypothetical protein